MMKKYIVNKSKLLENVIFTLLCFICILYITNRDQYLPDYQMYLSLYNSQSILVEISFNYLSILFNWLFDGSDGFKYFLFLYAILGFGLHMLFFYFYIKKEQGWIRFLFFMLTYFCYFYIFWDLIQIRYSVGISFLIFGMFCKSKKHAIIFFGVAIFFHNSMILPAGLFFLYAYLKKDYLKVLAIPLISVIAFLGLSFTRYSEKYEQGIVDWDHLNLLGGNCLILYTLVISNLFFKKYIKDKYSKTIISLMYTVSVMTVLIVILNSGFPAIANRLLALTLFLSFICSVFVFNKYNLIFFVIISMVFSLWNLNIIVLDPTSFFNTKWYHY